MKKIALTILVLVTTIAVFGQSTWNAGISFASVGNHSRFSGGMHEAHAQFQRYDYGTGALGVVFTKKINERLRFQTGLNFMDLGFEFGMAQNYSLLNEASRFSGNSRTNVSTANIPAALLYNFKTNCRNWRWYIGGGVSSALHSEEKQLKNENADCPPYEDNSPTSKNGITQTMKTSSFAKLNGQVIIGREKLLKNGQIFSMNLIFNQGFSTVATTKVRYTMDGTDYNHSFTNYGSYCGLSLTYHFKPFGSKNKL